MKTTKKIFLAALAGTALLAASGAQARDGRDGRWDNGYRSHGSYNYGYHRHYAPRVVVRPAYSYYAPRYVAPAPYYYAPPAPVYYQPAPALYGRIPLGHHSSIGFSLPLY